MSYVKRAIFNNVRELTFYFANNPSDLTLIV
jgi:hypothetical protein